MIKHLLSVLAFIVISFSVQGLNHFVINKAHYDAIEFTRAKPIFVLGFLAMIVQGLILSLALEKISPKGANVKDGLLVSLSFGLFLAVYIAFAEPAKYAAPSILSWVATEGLASSIQFVLFGLALAHLHKNKSSNKN